MIDRAANRKVASLPLHAPPRHFLVIAGGEPDKALPIRSALGGRLADALITDELTAAAVRGDSDHREAVARTTGRPPP